MVIIGTRLDTRCDLYQKRVLILDGHQSWYGLQAPLTNNEILKAKPQEKDFALHDGDGLFLLVKTSGKKLWRFRYQRPKSSSRINLSLDSHPAPTLSAVRQMGDQYLSLLVQGIDPQKQQEESSEQLQIELNSIFSVVAARGFQLISKGVTEDYA